MPRPDRLCHVNRVRPVVTIKCISMYGGIYNPEEKGSLPSCSAIIGSSGGAETGGGFLLNARPRQDPVYIRFFLTQLGGLKFFALLTRGSTA